MAVTAEISCIPMGTGQASVSAHVAAALRALEQHPDVRYELTAMGTALAGERDAVLAACGAMHAAVLASGAPRCYTIVKLDERTDKQMDFAEKVASVREKL